ncbi:hypothetical protein GP486_000531 [Trichoglossum hirsutum]|uniref:SNF2 N-terminal domain-containing protein n=1 Tax=Trichoglossum hirsutum TaxID=265104 RepID=A0A9P8LIK9_9PEZI|nr:hypothetical protein GP486_000531 [Trichoglossum hirsutum]
MQYENNFEQIAPLGDNKRPWGTCDGYADNSNIVSKKTCIGWAGSSEIETMEASTALTPSGSIQSDPGISMTHLGAQQSSSFSHYNTETEDLMFVQSGDAYTSFVGTTSENFLAFPNITPSLSSTFVDPSGCPSSYFPDTETFGVLSGPCMDVSGGIFDNENRDGFDEVPSAELMTIWEAHTAGFSEVQGVNGQTLDGFQTGSVALPTTGLVGPPSLLSPCQRTQKEEDHAFGGSLSRTTDDTPLSGTSTSLSCQNSAQLSGLGVTESPSSDALFSSRVTSEDDSLWDNGQGDLITNGETFGTEPTTLNNQTIPNSAHGDSSKLSTRGGSPSNEYNTCFGMITVDFSSTLNGKDEDHIPTLIRLSGEFLKVYTAESNKYAGIFISPVVSRLLKEFPVTITATLEAVKFSKDKKPTVPSTEQCSLHMVLYGLLTDKACIADLLSDADLFLQHPLEYDMHVPYDNPHYLVRPGSCMPPLRVVASASALNSVILSKKGLDETEKNQLLKVFNSANCVDVVCSETPSPRLRSSLKDYRHVITGTHQKSHPTSIFGGILADFGIYHGHNRQDMSEDLDKLDIVLTTYETLRSDWASCGRQSVLHEKVWARVVLDEGKEGISLFKSLYTRLRCGVWKVGWKWLSGGFAEASRAGLGIRSLCIADAIRRCPGGRITKTPNKFIARAPAYDFLNGLISHYLAHRIRNRTSDTFEAACYIQARNRWCLTGTPIHNSLDDYGALLSFIQVSPFTSKTAFDYWIAKPIKQQQPQGFERLRKLVSATCLRRTKDIIKQELQLPPRIEREELIELDTSDRELYNFIRARTARLVTEISLSDKPTPRRHGGSILPIINHLRRICNHGIHLLPPDVIKAWQTRDSTILDRSARNKKCDACNLHDDVHHSEPGGSEMCHIHAICRQCATQWYEHGSIDEEHSCPICSGYFECGTVDTFASADATIANTSQTDYQPSAKIRALLRNLTLEQQPDLCAYTTNPTKSIVFSYWTGMLNLVARALGKDGFIFQRVDGQTELPQRIKALELFGSDPSCTVMLASIGSIGEGSTMAPRCSLRLLTRILQKYVQWIQQDKLRLIQQSLGVAMPPQGEVDDKRWKVSRVSKLLTNSELTVY